MTLKITPDAIFSQESDCGIMLLTSHDGKKIVPFGQDHVPVSHSVPQVDKQVKKTIDIYGPNGSGSSRSVNLQLSLENRLRQRLPMGGSMMFIKGWKRRTTPSGRLFSQLQPSVRPTDESVSGLWPTCRASTAMSDKVETVLKNVEKRGYKGKLEQAVALWATPNCMDSLPKRSPEKLQTMHERSMQGRTSPSNLREQVHPEMYPAMWATPTVRDHKDTPGMAKKAVNPDGSIRNRNDQLGRQVFGSTAPTGSKGSLNPQFPCWLMGFPKEWVSSIVQGMQSYRKSPQSSYEPLLTKIYRRMFD